MWSSLHFWSRDAVLSTLTSVRRYWPILLIVLLTIDFFVARWWLLARKEKRFDSIILASAKRYGLEPALVKAVIWKESAFNPEAKGLAGEVGLMQIRSLAAKEWATAERIDAFDERSLNDPRTNTLIGAWYLSKLLKRYRQTDNPLPFALADYNAGRANVLRWKTGQASTNHANFIQQITFPSTQSYIQLVTQRQSHYRNQFQPLAP